MNDGVLFSTVKDDGIQKETFIEHAIRTYHVGKFLYKKINPEFDYGKYLFACFFHDVGKLVIRLGEEVHTPRSKEGLDRIKNTPEYQAILKNFGLEDYSENEEVIKAIENHHDTKNLFEGFVSIADQLASSTNNEDLKNRSKLTAISTMITFLNENYGFHNYNFFYVTIPSFSKNELNSVGKLLLLKILYETIEDLEGVELLYETLDGCRVVTEFSSVEVREKISNKFNKNFVEFFKNQDIGGIIGGTPQAFKQYNTLPKDIKPELVKITVNKYINDILNELKKNNIENLEDIGLSEEIFLKFAQLPELKEYYSNIKGTKYALLADKDGNYNKWVVDAFKIKVKDKDSIVEQNKPVIEELLEKAGADILNITKKEVVYNKLFPLVMAINSLNSADIEYNFDISKFLAIDYELNLSEIPNNKENVCANCGTFRGTIPLETFTFGHRQHYRESLFQETNDKIRKGKILVCSICQAEALLNSLLCGISIENQNARINTKTHLILYGLDIDRNLIEELSDNKLAERLLKEYRINHVSIWAKSVEDMQIALFSLDNFEVGIKNEIFKCFLFSLICQRLKEENPLILAFGVNKVPSFLDNSKIQFSEKDEEIMSGKSLDFFEYVYNYVNTKYDTRRDYILQYHNRPLIGIAQILKREKTKFSEETEKVVKKLADSDLYGIMDDIWEMAKLSGALETGKNVGSFLGVFRGYPEDLDKMVNRFMKNEKLSNDKRSQVIEIYSKLREEILDIDDKKRRELRDYAQKTKYLFNSMKFYQLKKEKEDVLNGFE